MCCSGVTEVTTTSVLGLEVMTTRGELSFAAIDLNRGGTKSVFDIVYRFHHPLNDGIIRDACIDWREARTCIRGDAPEIVNVSQGCLLLNDGIARETDVTIGGTRALVRCTVLRSRATTLDTPTTRSTW